MATNAVVVMLVAFAALAVAYVVYGRFLARRVFRLDATRPTPAHQMRDGIDYIPTRVPVLFGHHFASIAGLGPILGPAIAVIWGWVPAMIWVVVGCIFLGAVHDLGALTVSLHFRGRSIGDVCRELIGPRARFLFLLIIFFLMSLAMGAFVNAISALFLSFNPDAIIPSLGLMLVAMAIGIAVYRLGIGLGPATAIGLAAFLALIVWGVDHPVLTYQWAASEPTRMLLDEARAAESPLYPPPYGAAAAQLYLRDVGHLEAEADLVAAVASSKTAWILVLLAYGFVASVLPVWLLLQPRDYINSFQLYVALAMMVGGLLVAAAVGHEAARIDAPAVRTVADAPPMIPFLLVTIACGAVSGFHSLVSSGTTVRQLDRETDALPIGFGAMLIEGALAVLIIMACVAGLGAASWGESGPYASWSNGISGAGLGAQLSAVVRGGATFFAQLGLPPRYGEAFLAVTVVAFALTTLDSATRLLRFNVEEIFRSLGLTVLANRYIASFVAVLGIGFFGLSKQGSVLWILFGTANQLLAGLTLLAVSLFLFKLGRPVVYTLLPMVIMLGVAVWAMLYNLAEFFGREPRPWSLIATSIVVLAMTCWLVVEAALSFRRGRGGLIVDTAPAHHDEEIEQAAASSHLG